jgi:hypothetical protein
MPQPRAWLARPCSYGSRHMMQSESFQQRELARRGRHAFETELIRRSRRTSPSTNENEHRGTSPALSWARVQTEPPQTMSTSPTSKAALANSPVPRIGEGAGTSRASNHVCGRKRSGHITRGYAVVVGMGLAWASAPEPFVLGKQLPRPQPPRVRTRSQEGAMMSARP